jgi:hypothetical protein
MKFLLTSSALVAVLALAPANAQQPPPQPAAPPAVSAEKEGKLTVQGVEPSKVLGAIDTEKLTDQGQARTEAQATAETETAAKAEATAQPASGKKVTVDTETTQTADAKVEVTTETVTPVSGRPALDPDHPIAPEVQAVVDSKKRYTTADIVMAQLEAIRNTPVVEPTTVTTTTTVTPNPG